MIVNAAHLIAAAPIKDMQWYKESGPGGVSFGMSEAGYDIRIKQTIVFTKNPFSRLVRIHTDEENYSCEVGRFALASAIEEFDMPTDLVGIVHDKSTWARRGLSVFNTVIEPGFKGGLTLELVYHGEGELIIPAGSGIAQVVFHQTTDEARYSGKYQFQSTDPEPARDSV